MSIQFKVLGLPGQDNALLVRVDTGQALHRLLFDCGEGCLDTVSVSEIQAIDHLLFSHLHIDHVAGFDSFFRCNFGRTSKPNIIWGPPQTAEIMQCRMRGFMWNLHAKDRGEWIVNDVDEDVISSSRFHLGEAFQVRHSNGEPRRTNVLIDHDDYTVQAFTMDHQTPSLAYLLRENPRENINLEALRELGLTPGRWLDHIKHPRNGPAQIDVAGIHYEVARLREQIVVITPGKSLAYLTDFLLDDAARERLLPAIHGCNTMICESQYRQADLDLAIRNTHMTSIQAATLARDAQAGELILFHVSDRYQEKEWAELLEEAQQVFPATRFSGTWEQ